jgi:hypothetical protein
MKAYPAEVELLLKQVSLPPLGPGQAQTGQRGAIEAACRELPLACQAGLWLAFDFLEESHTISQDLHTPEGSFWHAIMHRREPDAWNSKYWWRKVGSHPVLGQLRERGLDLGYRYTTAEDFVDLCERVRGTGGKEEELAKRVQQLEWELLFAWCWERA